MQILVNDQIYEKINFSKEEQFEDVIAELSDKIFGEQTIYLDIKRKIKGSNIGVIPDGYLIDMTISGDPKLYVVENEIVSHDPFKHIGIQMLKFATSFDDEKLKIRNIIMSEISKNPVLLERLNFGCKDSKSRNIDNYLDKAVFNEFKGLVIIDEAREELYKVLEKINANISVLEVKTYQSENNEFAYYYDTLYESESEIISYDESRKQDITNKQKRRQRRAECDTIVVPARDDGFQEVFIEKNQWYAIRIGAAMKDRIKYIAAYQTAPVSAVTHIAEISNIRPYQDTGKYIVYFKGEAKKIGPKKLRDPKKSPQGPMYVKYQDLLNNKYLDDSTKY